MPGKMNKSDILFGPDASGKIDFGKAAKALEKYFKASSGCFDGGSLKKTAKSAIKNAGAKDAYVKLGIVAKQIVFRVKTEGKLSSTHLSDDVVIKSVDETRKLLAALDNSFEKVMGNKANRTVYKEFGNNPKLGGIGNEIGFLEISENKKLPADKKKKIYSLFLDPKGKYEVNISGTARKKLMAFAAKNDFEAMDFEVARKEVASMLKSNYPSLLSRLSDANWNKFW